MPHQNDNRPIYTAYDRDMERLRRREIARWNEKIAGAFISAAIVGLVMFLRWLYR